MKRNEGLELTNTKSISNGIITSIKMRLKTKHADGFIFFSHIHHTIIAIQLKAGMICVEINDDKGKNFYFIKFDLGSSEFSDSA